MNRNGRFLVIFKLDVQYNTRIIVSFALSILKANLEFFSIDLALDYVSFCNIWGFEKKIEHPHMYIYLSWFVHSKRKIQSM